jgi:hypothetical protein
MTSDRCRMTLGAQDDTRRRECFVILRQAQDDKGQAQDDTRRRGCWVILRQAQDDRRQAQDDKRQAQRDKS